jgi:hypothetical protein
MLFPLLAGFAAAQTADRTFGLLKDDRKLVLHVPYTPEQRVQVAKNINELFKIYYHREQKINVYGKEYGREYDPIPRAQKILQNAANMTDAEFHYGFAEIFSSMRDFHLNYNQPAPHACLAAVQAVNFGVIESKAWFGLGQRKNTVVVRSFATQPEAVALAGEALKQIEIGDELITVDGLDFDQIVEKRKFLAGGANESGALRSVLRQLSVIGGRYNRMPEKDDVTYVFKSYKTGKRYTVTLPWILRARKTCYETAKAFIDGGMVSNSFTEYVPTGKGISKANEELLTYKETFWGPKKPQEPFVLKDTSDPIIKWGIYKPESKKLGVLFIEGFTPVDGDDYKVTLLIRSLLLNELKDTNGLIIDIRENGGGSGLMSDMIPQLFLPSTNATASRAINHPNNRALFEGTNDLAFLSAMDQTKNGERYTPWVPGTPQSQLRKYGMAYVKPVGVFTSGECYSACDYFSANMQDVGGVIIFGEDKFTGAGGADVIEYTGYLRRFAPQVFEPMPFVNELKEEASDARVSWRGGRRFGKNDGKPIEDFGIQSERIIRPAVKDFLPGSTTQTQFDYIASELEKYGVWTGKKWMQFQVLNELEFDVQLGESLNLDLEVQGFKKVVVSFEGEKQVGNLDINVLQVPRFQKLKLPLNVASEKPAVKRLEILGYNLLNQVSFATFRQIRLLPKKEDYLQVAAGSTIDLLSLQSNAVFQADLPGTAGKGWNKNGTSLQFGNGVQYENNMDSKISYFVNPSSAPYKLAIKAKYITEEGYDYFYVGYKNQNGVTQLLPEGRVAGTGEIDSTFEVPATDAVEIFVQFITDPAITDVGVTISTLTLSA